MEQPVATTTGALVEAGAVKAGVAPMGLVPRTFEGLYRMAKIMAASGMMPRGVNTPEAVFVAVQMGLEVGLSPMQAVQSIAVINGRPSIWGDAVLGLVRSSGLLEDFMEFFEGDGDELTAVCVAKRRGERGEIRRTFSVADAKQAGLLGKEGPWRLYPKRMLQMRSRSWALRDGFGDVLKGLRVAEEAIDYDLERTVEMAAAPQSHGSKASSYVMASAPSPSAASLPAQSEGGSVLSEFDRLFFADFTDVESALVDEYLRTLQSKNHVSLDDIKSQAVQHWDRFAKAFRKFLAKHRPAAADEDITETQEYAELKQLIDDFPEAAQMARRSTGIPERPVTMAQVAELKAAISAAVDMLAAEDEAVTP